MNKERDKRDRAKMFRDDEDSYMRGEVEDKLEEFEEKHKFSRELRLQYSLEKINGENGVAARNIKAAERFDDMKKDFLAKQNLRLLRFEESEDATNRQLRKAHREVLNLYTHRYNAVNDQFHMMANRKAKEESARKERAREMMEKLQRSQKAVEAFMKEQAHKNMLATEQRKLQDDDMKKVHERHRRLETRKKNQIMDKESRDLEVVKEVKGREDKLVQFRYRNRVAHNV